MRPAGAPTRFSNIMTHRDPRAFPRSRTKPLARAPLCAGAQFENVSQELMSPLFKPMVNHFWRCAEEPWVKLSGTA